MVSKVRIATWNINSVRLRIDLVRHFVESFRPDVLCLQETKCPDDRFPAKAFREMGFPYHAVHGQKGYHGVATLSKLPIQDVSRRSFCGKQDARHVAVSLEDDIVLHNFYIPAGGDVPDPKLNEKFAHKLDFVDEATALFKRARSKKTNKFILVGDLNIAPLESDVWSHKQLLKVVSHTPIEVERMKALKASHSWVDVTRREKPEPEKVFTWWSYRSPDWTKNDRGRRLDHIWVTPALDGRSHGVEVLRDARSWKRPSDHVPVLMSVDV